MIGAIAGDIVGSVYEHSPFKSKDFPLFQPGCRVTDDTICTLAIADCLLASSRDFANYLRKWVQRYPFQRYGAAFRRWGLSNTCPPNPSYGNGAAMRVTAIIHMARDEQEGLALAKQSAVASHNHPQAIDGAQAVVLAGIRAKQGISSSDIRQEIEDRISYDMAPSVDDIRPGYAFDMSCAGSVPQAITCALEASSFEDAIRNAVSLGGDTVTRLLASRVALRKSGSAFLGTSQSGRKAILIWSYVRSSRAFILQ